MRLLWTVTALLVTCQVSFQAQSPSVQRLSIGVMAASELGEWNQRLDSLVATSDLARQETRIDPLVGRQHERLSQYYRGLPVYGGDVTRQSDGGVVTSIFGTLFEGIEVDTTPRLSYAEAVARVPGSRLDGTDLVVLPGADASYHLAYRLQTPLQTVFVDAQNGALLFEIDKIRHQAAVGQGRGVRGDLKKLSTARRGNTYRALDLLRPARIQTIDGAFRHERAAALILGEVLFSVNDLAADDDNEWGDGETVDTHAALGWTYDYLYKRFNWAGLNDRNGPIFAMVHGIDPSLADTVVQLASDCRGKPLEGQCLRGEVWIGMLDNAFYAPPSRFLSDRFPTGIVVLGEPVVSRLPLWRSTSWPTSSPTASPSSHPVSPQAWLNPTSRMR